MRRRAVMRAVVITHVIYPTHHLSQVCNVSNNMAAGLIEDAFKQRVSRETGAKFVIFALSVLEIPLCALDKAVVALGRRKREWFVTQLSGGGKSVHPLFRWSKLRTAPRCHITEVGECYVLELARRICQSNWSLQSIWPDLFIFELVLLVV